jgi:hypothetical protein
MSADKPGPNALFTHPFGDEFPAAVHDNRVYALPL